MWLVLIYFGNDTTYWIANVRSPLPVITLFV